MSKRRVKLYDGEVYLSDEDVVKLKKVFVNHLLIYNFALDTLYSNPEIPFNRYADSVSNEIRNTELSPIIRPALLNEIYYQFKKFRRNVRSKKQLTDIQYITFTVSKYVNDQFEVNEEGNKLVLNDTGIVLNMEEPLPDPGKRNFLYFNLSYSSSQDRFMLSVYGSYSN